MRPPTAAVVEMQRLYGLGLGYIRIARRLNQTGYTNSKGAPWTKGAVNTLFWRRGWNHDTTNRRGNGRFLPATLQIKAEDAGYLAGIIDGEGTLEMRPRPTKSGVSVRYAVTVANTSPELMAWLSGLGGRVYAHGGGVLPCWNWVVTRRADVVLLLKAVEPHLRIKRDLALRMLQDIEP